MKMYNSSMESTIDNVTVTIPRPLLAGLARVTASLTERMHELLEKNTENIISEAEKKELESLVRLSQLDQIVTLALHSSKNP
jgi:hypothetical protein